jgi:high-affinity iron transporter
MRFRVVALVLSLCLFAAVAGPLSAQNDMPLWQAGSAIRDHLFNAQNALLSGDSAADKQTAAGEIAQAQALYESAIQPALHTQASDADQAITAALMDAEAAAEKGDSPALAYAGGLVWTNLLRGSALAAAHALTAGDSAGALAWLRLREYKQATKFNRVDDPAVSAVTRLQAGGGNADDVTTTVNNDLRDTYAFRLRDALNKLEDAAGQGFATRTADWAARVGGYFAILESDFTAKRGPTETDALRGQLAALKASALKSDFTGVTASADAIKTALATYQPVELTAAEIAQRAQLLYLFIDLVHVEYGRGVENGQITLQIEYQEATSFRNQASALYEELRPVMKDSQAADQLGAKLSAMKDTMVAVGAPDALKALSDQALALAKSALQVEANLTDVSASFTIIDTMLKDMKTAVFAGDHETAERKRLEAYAILDSGIEQRLRGFAPDIAAQVESLFWQGLSDQPGLSVLLANRASRGEVDTALTKLNTALADGQAALNVAKSAPEAVVGNAAVIVFREGLEAVLILASLIGGMRAAESRKYRRSLALGAGLAMVGAVITWLLFSTILAALGNLGERLEAVVSLIAIGVLLLITNWFFHKTYWVGWMANFHSQKGRILGGAAIVGPTVGLVILGFTSVYREVFETVLFLQSLVLDAGAATVLEGVAIGLLGTAVVGFITFKLQVRLPYKRMLIFTGVLIGGVLLTMVGNTVHVLQVVGWMPITPISGVYLPYWLGRWFGVFATWQGILLQIAAGVFVIGSYFWAERLNHRKRETATTRRVEAASQPALRG